MKRRLTSAISLPCGIGVSLALAFSVAAAPVVTAQGGGFVLEKLPAGSELTLPQPATTVVAPASRVTVASTDSPQTLRIVPINVQGGLAQEVRISIFDAHQDRVRYVDLKPGMPFLYNFRKLSSIAILVDPASQQKLAPGVRLQIESDKPLTIRH